VIFALTKAQDAFVFILFVDLVMHTEAAGVTSGDLCG
jgi:hypothetical protein